MDMLQVSPGKTVFRYLTDAAVLGVAVTEQFQENSADLALSFSAVSLDDHHPLSLVTGNQAVANEFLKRQDILRIQKIIQKMQPAFRLGCIGVITDWETAPDDFRLLLIEGPVQHQGSVGQMNPVRLRRQRFGKRHDLQQIYQIGDLLGHIGMHKRLGNGIDCLFQNGVIIQNTFLGEKGVFAVNDGMIPDEALTEHRFVDILSVIPVRPPFRPLCRGLLHGTSPSFPERGSFRSAQFHRC